jgi:hypothetical protein
MSASKKSGQLTCYQTGQFYLLPTASTWVLDLQALCWHLDALTSLITP